MIATIFKHKVVQDLAWVMECPTLLNAKYIPTLEQGLPVILDNTYCTNLLNSSRQWLLGLDHDPAPLRRFLSGDRSKRLGHYFELLVEYWIRERLEPEFFKAHIQIFDNGRTIGEYDFLFSNDGNHQLIHLEVAVKYYLYHRSDDGTVEFIGPNANDRLARKFNYLLDHQLKLSQCAPGLQAIHRLGFSATIPTVLMKGYLFYPSNTTRAGLPPYVSEGHLKGWWTDLANFAVPCQKPENRWLILDKQHWLGPKVHQTDARNDLMDKNELQSVCIASFRVRQRSLLVVELEQKKSGYWEEVTRGFVVSNYWPDRLKIEAETETERSTKPKNHRTKEQ